jgi:penicillin-binding protein 2
VDALAFSCDVFFYNVGRKLGVDEINRYARNLGLGIKTGMDLPYEEPGLIPSKEWKKEYTQAQPEYTNQPWEWQWRTGDTLNMSIGQGSVSTTPLQNAVMMASIVNSGYRVRPFLDARQGPKLYGPFLSKETVEIVREGMLKCIEKDPPAPTGTGNEAKLPGVSMAGKTGSAQVVAIKHYEDFATEDDIPRELRDHAWFVAGVLNLEPRIAMCILVEHGLHGSSAAAPLAKAVAEYFYRGQLPQVTVVADGETP